MTDLANPEQLLFASTTRTFLDKHASLTHVRELHARDTSFDRTWWQRAVELGWTSLLVPEELGGGSVSGDGVADLALVAEQMGHTVAPGPLHPVSVVLAGLVEAPHGHEDTIEGLVSGELIASWAVYEPRRPFAPLRADTTATRTDSGYRIDGVKDRVEAGADSDAVLVVATCDGAIRQFLVPTDAPGVTVTVQNSVDMVKSYARMQFDGVAVDGSAVVGTAEQTAAIIERQRQIALVLQCAEIVGILDSIHHDGARKRQFVARVLQQLLADGLADKDPFGLVGDVVGRIQRLTLRQMPRQHRFQAAFQHWITPRQLAADSAILVEDVR